MKLIYQITIILWFTIRSNSQKFSQEQFPFPPQFKSPNPTNGVFGSDKSIYLPPESHTTIPYYSVNNGNKIPFHFLPPTATKAPSMYPTPFPMVMSSTMVSRRQEEDHENETEVKPRMPHNQTPSFRVKNDNQTNNSNEFTEDREMRSNPKNFNYQHAMDRIDIKYPPQIHTATQKIPVNQTPASQRRMIISSEILKNDQGLDQIRRASLLGSQLSSSPISYYSTTEPAIPIIRLSNEMDLDGSFSYEALGADQTHYVQHSRMENSGTDKEEQIVEGSYSYVGDNGQTYTVHYVADSNGYRASGDHLPVPPPIPEIIQRAIQYNLAEEAKKPAHQKSWQENENEYVHSESEKHRFSLLPPPRNLFTGRTPEAFSFGLTQSTLLQNKIATDDSSQIPVKTNFDFSSDQSNKGKSNNGPIAPQITFLASQGAHKPTINTGHQQISRIFATDKPTLPQLMNYEASSSESDQDNNKALWRWQYGLNANGAIDNQHPNKNSISRSFGEGDDVIINFNNMSPEQYTKMIKNEFIENNTEDSTVLGESKNKEGINTEPTPFLNSAVSESINAAKANKITDAPKQKNIDNPLSNEHQSIATENIIPYTISSDWSKHMEGGQHNDKLMYVNNNYVTPTSLPTQSYEYSEKINEPFKSKLQHSYETTESQPMKPFREHSNDKSKEMDTANYFVSDNKNSDSSFSSNDPIWNHNSNIKFTDFIQNEDTNNFKPIINTELKQEPAHETTTDSENIIRENYFLKNLFKTENEYPHKQTEVTKEPIKLQNSNINLEPKFDKIPKLIQFQSKTQNEIKNINKKPLDITDVLNYITLKNHFESNKLKSKGKFSNSDKLSQIYERPQIFIPLENNSHFEEEEQLDQQETQNNFGALNNHKQHELRGIIKNYKVLQRNSNTKTMGQNKDQALTDSSHRHKTFQTQNLPPLGRAGPSMKSYLPPTYL